MTFMRRHAEERPGPRWPVFGLALAGLGLAALAAASHLEAGSLGNDAKHSAGRDEWSQLALAPLGDSDPLSTGALDLEEAAKDIAGKQVLSQEPQPGAVPIRLMGEVGENLPETLAELGVPERIAAAYLQALATRIDLSKGVGVSDLFDLIIEKVDEPDGSVRYGRLLYAGLDRKGAPDIMLVRWVASGRLDWIDMSGVGSSMSGMRWPVNGGVSSGYGNRRHPIYGGTRFHRGVDLRASFGTPVAAAADGTVVATGWRGGYGRQVKIRHRDGLVTTYSHLSRTNATPGGQVRQGQIVGYVGSSGASTGAHLHYEVFKGGRSVDPRSVPFERVNKVGREEQVEMRQYLRALLEIVPYGMQA